MVHSTQQTSAFDEKRRAPRRQVEFNVKFAFTDFEFRTPVRVEAEGQIVDVSEKGFGLVTNCPKLQRGHVITILKDGQEDVPEYGVVKWIMKMDDNYYRVGLGFRYMDE